MYILFKMVNAVAQDSRIEEIANMSKNIASILIILLLGACASGGGSAGLNVQPENRAVSTSPTPTDPRHQFTPVTHTYSPNLSGHSETVTHKLDMTSYTTSGLPNPTDKYKIADYGFFRSTITGYHDGYDAGAESSIMNSFLQRGEVQRADLNGDGWQDFYLVLWAGDHDKLEFAPNSYVYAWINDGDGNFILDNDIFADGNPCVAGTNCNSATHNKGLLVADFNGDGIDDLYHGSNLILSDSGKLYTHTDRIPAELSNCEGGKFCFTHDAYASDVEGDNDIDIFLPISQPDVNNVEVPWTMLLNDGAGNFSVNQNFPDATDSLFATTAVIGDFDNDGSGDVAVGWFQPGSSATFSQTYENSAGAVFWNDGQNDWSVRPWSELPNNYYGSNGNANDMEVIDFNNDGLLDIVLASTKHEPYYDGRMIQFFVNNGDGTFGDVTGTYNTNTKYADGLNNGIWNGDGQIHIIDFDADGDLDIVDSVRGSYVLLNEGGSFTLYDDFPRFGDNNKYYPIEIDNKYFYDFIGSTNSYSDTESIATFFQVLDPPLLEMMHDITTKPLGYADSIFESTMLLNDLRKQTKGNNLFGKNVEGTNMIGYNYSNNNGIGLHVADLSGESNGSVFGVNVTRGKVHLGLSYVTNDFAGENKTKWYGTGKADLQTESINAFMEYTHRFSDTLFSNVGATVSQIDVKAFEETQSTHNVHINAFDMAVGTLFADISKVFYSKLGTTYLTLGAEYYETREIDIVFSDILNYTHKADMTVGKFGLHHKFNIFYFSAELDTENREVYQLGFRWNLR